MNQLPQVKNKIDALFSVKLPILFCAKWDHAPFTNQYNLRKLLEYDINESSLTPCMGLGKKAKGIFIDTDNQKDILVLYPVKKGTYEEIKQSAKPVNKQMQEIMNEIKLKKSPCMTNFFGYLYSETSAHDNEKMLGFSQENFIEICIESSLKYIVNPENKQPVHIITPLSRKSTNFNSFIQALKLKYPDARIEYYDNAEEPLLTGNQNPSDIIRIVNPFPVPHHEFLAIMKQCNPFLVGCTGDQSVSDVLSIAFLPAYQCPSWKNLFIKNLMHIFQEQGGTLLKEFSDIYTDFFQKKLTETEFCNKISSFLANAMQNPQTLQEELKNIHDYIVKNKNIYNYIQKQYMSLLSNSDDVKLETETTEDFTGQTYLQNLSMFEPQPTKTETETETGSLKKDDKITFKK